jgi:hypothetical protein
VTSFLEKRAPKFPGKVSKDMPGFFPWWQNPTFVLADLWTTPSTMTVDGVGLFRPPAWLRPG